MDSTVTATSYIFDPPAIQSLPPLRGKAARYAVNRLFFVGRNYHAHAKEMGRPVDKTTSRPFYFTKSASTLVESGAEVPYPSQTKDYQFEMELVLAIAEGNELAPTKDLLLSVRIFVSRNEAIEQATHGRHHPSPRGKDRMHETRRCPQVR